MPLYFILLLAVVQGITEFLPISSSGHLVILHAFFEGPEFGAEASADWGEDLMLDVAVHVGTLFAVLLYFHKDIGAMLSGLFSFVSRKKARNTAATDGLNLVPHLIAGSVPVVLAGFLLHLWQPSLLRSLEVMAWATIFFALLLWWGDKKFPDTKTLKDMRLIEAFAIGIAQAFALVPGTSRSGVTMTAGRFLGFSRIESARFSLLLSIVAIAGAGLLTGFDLVGTGNLRLGADSLLAAFLSFLTALAAIALMMRWLARASFTPFVLYRLVMGVALLVLIYGGFVHA